MTTVRLYNGSVTSWGAGSINRLLKIEGNTPPSEEPLDRRFDSWTIADAFACSG
jgi:hypothetical protein